MSIRGKFGSQHITSFIVTHSEVVVCHCSVFYGETQIKYQKTIDISQLPYDKDLQTIFRLNRSKFILVLPPSLYEVHNVDLKSQLDNITPKKIKEIINSACGNFSNLKQTDYTNIANKVDHVYAVASNKNHLLSIINHFGKYKSDFTRVTTFDNACLGLIEPLGITNNPSIFVALGTKCSRIVSLSANGLHHFAPIPNVSINDAGAIENENEIFDQIKSLIERQLEKLNKDNQTLDRIIISSVSREHENNLTKLIKKTFHRTEPIPPIRGIKNKHMSPAELACVGICYLRANETSIAKPVNLLPSKFKVPSLRKITDQFTVFRLFVLTLVSSSFIGIQAYYLNHTLIEKTSSALKIEKQLADTANQLLKTRSENNAIAVVDRKFFSMSKGFKEDIQTLSDAYSGDLWINEFSFSRDNNLILITGASFEKDIANKFFKKIKRYSKFSNIKITYKEKPTKKQTAKKTPFGKKSTKSTKSTKTIPSPSQLMKNFKVKKNTDKKSSSDYVTFTITNRNEG